MESSLLVLADSDWAHQNQGLPDWHRACHGCKSQALCATMYEGALRPPQDEAHEKFFGLTPGVYAPSEKTAAKVENYSRSSATSITWYLRSCGSSPSRCCRKARPSNADATQLAWTLRGRRARRAGHAVLLGGQRRQRAQRHRWRGCPPTRPGGVRRGLRQRRRQGLRRCRGDDGPEYNDSTDSTKCMVESDVGFCKFGRLGGYNDPRTRPEEDNLRGEMLTDEGLGAKVHDRLHLLLPVWLCGQRCRPPARGGHGGTRFRRLHR